MAFSSSDAALQQANRYGACAAVSASEQLIGGFRGRGSASAEEKPQEENNRGDEGSNGVEERIPRGGGAAYDECLMDLIKCGVAGGNGKGNEGPRPAPALALATRATEKQKVENEVFGEVRRLANVEMIRLDLRFGGGAKDPAQYGLKD